MGFQVFDKATAASVLGPVGIATVWSGFGGVCQTNGDGVGGIWHLAKPQ